MFKANMRVLLAVSLALFVFCSMANVASGRSFWEVIDGISKKQSEPYCPEATIECDSKNGDADCIGKWGCNQCIGVDTVGDGFYEPFCAYRPDKKLND